MSIFSFITNLADVMHPVYGASVFENVKGESQKQKYSVLQAFRENLMTIANVHRESFVGTVRVTDYFKVVSLKRPR